MSDTETQATGIWTLYRQSLKPSDSRFNLYFARPLAAPLVFLFAKTRITPNQITFISTFIMVLALTVLVCVESMLGLWIALFGIELSYVFDCVDGQLARVTKRSSEVGGDLDFMMDELKAYMLIAAIGIRGALYTSTAWQSIPTWWSWPIETWPLACATLALVATASAISLTRFIRSERYAIATGTVQPKHGQSAGEGRSGGPLWPIKVLARLITQYPASLPLFVITNTLDLFLYAYAILHVLYAGQASLGIFLKLGRFAPKTSISIQSGTEEQR